MSIAFWLYLSTHLGWISLPAAAVNELAVGAIVGEKIVQAVQADHERAMSANRPNPNERGVQ